MGLALAHPISLFIPDTQTLSAILQSIFFFCLIFTTLLSIMCVAIYRIG